MQDSKLVAFTDGACTNNGKRGAKASFSCIWPNAPEYNGAWLLDSSDKQTNNRGEILGVLKAFETANIIDESKQNVLYIYSDSMYTVNSINIWLKNWVKNNFKKADGKPVLNQDLFEILQKHMKERKYIVKHVMAHTGKTDWMSVNNALADKMAQDILSSS